ncbi:hypothetical protein [Otariodibacter oris]|uniref:Lipoprotein n=1 Tax=Otariodibacter oris TaxID=1032623 RepID=A0A420XIS0_9PAST|nr:hypothetical protein [Otariodibacter oris]QGM80849.1 hypothetical protein A6A10_05245 [Otariodibacter oris]RKR76980.1 hypothetical protein DES31_0293 [Otariodibacter oris]
MKRFFILVISFFVLSGCMTSRDPLVWFWNNGFKMSDKEREAYHTCHDEAHKLYDYKTQSELWYEVVYKCLEEKGY